MLVRMRRKGNPLALLVECKLVSHSGEQYGGSSKKLKIELPYDPAIALVDIYPKDTKIQMWRSACTTMFIVTSSIIAKLWRIPKCPSTDEWIKKMWYMYNGILLSHQKEQNLAICNDMDGARVYYDKLNNKSENWQIAYNFTHMWNLKNRKKWTYGRGGKEWGKQTIRDSQW